MQWSKQQTSGAKGNPTKIKNHTATLYTHASGRQEIYLFGGYDGRRNHNDIHVLDCSTMIWTTPEVHGEKPPGRNGHTTTLAGDLLFVQGGWLGRGPLAADDIHMFDYLAARLIPECAGESPDLAICPLAITLSIKTRYMCFGGAWERLLERFAYLGCQQNEMVVRGASRSKRRSTIKTRKP